MEFGQNPSCRPLPATLPLEKAIPPNRPTKIAVFIGLAVGNGASSQHSIYHPPYTALVTAIKNACKNSVIVICDTFTPVLIARINDLK
eukprot:6182666-Pleurochrysis_carterae.AAC.1